MPTLAVNARDIAVDKEGYLDNLKDWDENVAEHIAQQHPLALTDAHWAVIKLLRNFYQEFETTPNMRVLVKHMRQQLGEEAGSSIYLMQLFGQSPVKLACKIAGLPKPTNCL